MHRYMHAALFPGILDTPVSLNHAETAWL